MREDYWTFSFNLDPNLNHGYTECFRQGDEEWWWFCDDNGNGPAAGGPPDFTGATFKAVHNGSERVL